MRLHLAALSLLAASLGFGCAAPPAPTASYVAGKPHGPPGAMRDAAGYELPVPRDR